MSSPSNPNLLHEPENAVPGRLLIAAVTTVAGLTACSPGTSPAPSTPPEQSPQHQTSTPAGEVQNPLDLSALNDPCQLLEPEQAAALGIDGEAKHRETPIGTVCKWEGDKVSVELAPETDVGGIAGIRSQEDDFDNYEDTTAAGYPAALVNFNEVYCTLAMGISDEDTLSVSAARYITDDPRHQNPCEFAKTVFTEVVKNIPPES